MFFFRNKVSNFSFPPSMNCSEERITSSIICIWAHTYNIMLCYIKGIRCYTCSETVRTTRVHWRVNGRFNIIIIINFFSIFWWFSTIATTCRDRRSGRCRRGACQKHAWETHERMWRPWYNIMYRDRDANIWNPIASSTMAPDFLFVSGQ